MSWLDLLSHALGAFRRRPLRFALTCAGVAIATGALVSMVGFALGMQEEAERPFRKFELVHRIDVTARLPGEHGDDRYHGFWRSGRRKASITRDQLEQIRALDGVELAYPEIEIVGARLTRSTGPEERETFPALSGLPVELGQHSFVEDALVAGRFFHSEDAAHVVLGTEIVAQLGFLTAEEAIGAEVKLHVSGPVHRGRGQFTHETSELPLRVAGVWSMEGWTAMGQPTRAYLPLGLAASLPGAFYDSISTQVEDGVAHPEPRYGYVAVRARSLADVPLIVERISALGLAAYALLSEFDEMRQAFVIIDAVLASVGAVALVIAALGILNTQLVSVLERTREIGIHKALGATHADVARLFLIESALVGALGGVGGLLLGYVVSLGIDFGVNSYTRSQGITEVLAAFLFPGWLLAGALLFAVLVSIASGVYPALRAARLDPIAALRTE